MTCCKGATFALCKHELALGAAELSFAQCESPFTDICVDFQCW